MWALLKQRRVLRLRPTTQRPSGPNAHGARQPGRPGAGSALSWFSIDIGVKDGRRCLNPFDSIHQFCLPVYAFVCLQNQTLHIREDAHSLFSEPQFERENITNNANPFLYCAEICPSVYVQSIYRNSIPKGNRDWILLGKCWRTVFTHELLTYQKSNEWAQRTSTISDTKTTSA